MAGLITTQDAGRIGRGIFKIEQMTAEKPTGESVSLKYIFAFAKITKNNEDGTYDAIEVLVDDALTAFVELDSGRVWKKDDEDTLEALFDISFDDGIEANTIVLVLRTNIAGQGGAAKWCIVGNNVAKSVSQTATDKSNTAVKGKVQFRNDIPFSDKPEPPFDFAFQAPPRVGSVTDGNRAYGGNEDTLEEFGGVQRHYKWMAFLDAVQDGYLMPGTAAFKQSVGDAKGLQFLNKMWIQFDQRFDGQTMEVHHMLCAQAFFDQADNKGKFSVTPAGGVQGTVWASATSGGATNIKCEYDVNGHLRKLDDSYGDEDDYPTDINISQVAGTYPSSGTLYNVSLTQTANLTDQAGVDTNAFNGGVGTLAYTALTAAGEELSIGFVSSTGNSLAAAATEYNGVGTGGNDDNIFWDLSKSLDGTDVKLKSFLIAENRSATATITDVESVQLVTTIETTPVPDNSSFDVKVELEDGIGGNAAQGTRFIRFDGDNEYQVVVYLFLEINKAAFDPDDNNTYLQKQTVTVDDQTTFSGGTVSFTENFEQEGVNVCARAYLEFFQANVNPQPLANQIGRCNISNQGDFAEDCQVIVGTAATSTLTFAADNYDLASIGASVNIGGFELRNVTPIKTVYKIQKGGDTTEFTGNPCSFQLKTPEGVDIRISEDGVTDDFSTVTLINPTDGDPTDGFEITINYIENSLISNGNQYIGNVNCVDVSDNPATDDFYFNTSSAFPATDFFGDRAADLAFSWFDFGGGDGTLKSTGLEGSTLFDTRWSRSNGGLNDPEGETLVGDFVTIVVDDPTVSAERAVYTSNAAALSGPFEISGDFVITPVITTSNKGPFTYFEMDIAGSRFNIGWAQGAGLNGLFYAFNGVDTPFQVQESGGNFNFKISRDSNDLVEVFIDGGNAIASVTKAGDLTNVDVWFSNGGGGSGTPSGATFTLTNFQFKAGNINDTLVNYFSPNADRWTQSTAGTAYQIVDPVSKKLDQIIPSSAGTDTVSTLSKFSGDKNIVNSLNSFLFTEILSNMSFPNSGDRVYMEVTNTNSDVWQIGFKNTGSGQFFFVDVGAGDVGTQTISTSGATIAIEFGRAGGNNVEFLLNGVIKHTIVDPGFDITDIDQHTTTTATGALSVSRNSIDVQAPTGTQFTFSP